MNLNLKNLVRLSLLAACAAGVNGALRAQTAPDSTAAPANSGVTTMEKYTVSDVPITEQVLPTVRPVGSVLGDDTPVIDIPRAVASINAAWMDDRQVKNAMDFGQFSPGVYSAAQYGIPAVPFIRGDLAQIYVDGQIMPFTRNSVPPSFNGVGAMDVVEGPGSAVYGPQGEGAGGYVNFVPKQPYFDHDHYDLSFTMSGWTSGHSYSNPEMTLDFGGPLSDKLAYRVSYLGRYGDGYYLNDKNQTQDGYVAFTYLATSKLRVDWWIQDYGVRDNEITGANRVTEQFIEKGTYIGGPAAPTTVGPNAFFGYAIVPPGTPMGSFGSIADGSFQTVTAATSYTVKLPAYDALIGPSDTSRSKLFQTQLKETVGLTPDMSVINRTYLAYGNSDKFETYGYDEYVPLQEAIQDRAELHAKFSAGSITNSLVTGVDFRYQKLTSYQDFATEPFSHYDLYQPLSNVFYPGYYAESKTWGGEFQVPGAPGYSAYANTSGNQYSHIYDSAAFFQDTVGLSSKLSAVLGVREDYIDADTANPSLVRVGVDSEATDFTFYPVTPTYVPKGALFKTSDTKVDPSYFVSLVFKLTDLQSFYVTYDHVDSVLGSANFGGVNVNAGDSVANGGPGLKRALDNSLSTKSTLYEVGYKQSMLNNTLFFSTDAFQQIKLGSEITGATFPIKDNGLEGDVVYQPNKSLTINSNITYQDATAFGTGFYQQTGNYLDNFAPGISVDGTHGSGVGGPNFESYKPPGNRMRAPGIPQIMINAFVEYKWANGFGFGVGPQFIGRQYANDQDTLHVPGETEWDGYVFYNRKTWDVRVNIKNLTDERLIDPIDVSFAGNDTIFVRQPITASFTFRLHY